MWFLYYHVSSSFEQVADLDFMSTCKESWCYGVVFCCGRGFEHVWMYKVALFGVGDRCTPEMFKGSCMGCLGWYLSIFEKQHLSSPFHTFPKTCSFTHPLSTLRHFSNFWMLIPHILITSFLPQAFLKTKCAECGGSCGLAKKYKETMAVTWLMIFAVFFCRGWLPFGWQEWNHETKMNTKK